MATQQKLMTTFATSKICETLSKEACTIIGSVLYKFG